MKTAKTLAVALLLGLTVSVLAAAQRPADLPESERATAASSLRALLLTHPGADTSDAAYQAAFVEALPIWGAAMLVMIAVAWMVMRSAGVKPVKAPPDANYPAGLPQLPEDLRTVSVPGRRYAIVTTTGQVIDRQMSGHPSLPHVQQDVLRVRLPDWTESSMTFISGAFMARPSDIVSTVARPFPDGTSDVLIAYNHTTDQLQMFLGMYAVHAATLLFPLLLVALVGSVPGAVGLAVMFHRVGGVSDTVEVALLTVWVMGAIASSLVAPFVVLPMKRHIELRRNRRFVSDYIPEYRRFFSESTSALARHFAGTGTTGIQSGPSENIASW